MMNWTKPIERMAEIDSDVQHDFVVGMLLTFGTIISTFHIILRFAG